MYDVTVGCVRVMLLALMASSVAMTSWSTGGAVRMVEPDSKRVMEYEIVLDKRRRPLVEVTVAVTEEQVEDVWVSQPAAWYTAFAASVSVTSSLSTVIDPLESCCNSLEYVLV